MLQDVIERFRYRLELWRRERREHSFFGGTWPQLDSEPRDRQAAGVCDQKRPDDSWRSVAPKHRVILTDSTLRFIVRTLVTYLAILLIVVASCLLVGTFVPSLRSVCLIVAIVLSTLWTLINVLGTTQIRTQRKEYRSWRQHFTNR